MGARAQVTDFLQAYRFHVTCDEGAPAYIKNAFKEPHGGFRTCSFPEFNTDAVTYKEGIWRMERKYPGNTTVTDCSLERGVVKSNNGFYDWIVKKINGQDYRTDLVIFHFHRDDWKSDAQHPDPWQVNTGSANRRIKLHEAFPIRCKLASDFDATSGEISVESIDLAFEWMELSVG